MTVAANCDAALSKLDEERVHLASSESRSAAQEAQLFGSRRDLSLRRGRPWSGESEPACNATVGELRVRACANERPSTRRVIAWSSACAERPRRPEPPVRRSGGQSGRKVASPFSIRRRRAEGAEAARDRLVNDLSTSKRLHLSLLRRVKPIGSRSLREMNAESAIARGDPGRSGTALSRLSDGSGRDNLRFV